MSTNTSVIECPTCSKRFSSISNLNRHIKTHDSLEGKACDICNKTFSRSDLLHKHKKIHEKVLQKRAHICKMCNFSSDRLYNVERHMENKHGQQKPAKIYDCPVCKATFATKGNYDKHRRKFHKRSVKQKSACKDQNMPLYVPLSSDDMSEMDRHVGWDTFLTALSRDNDLYTSQSSSNTVLDTPIVKNELPTMVSTCDSVIPTVTNGDMVLDTQSVENELPTMVSTSYSAISTLTNGDMVLDTQSVQNEVPTMVSTSDYIISTPINGKYIQYYII